MVLVLAGVIGVLAMAAGDTGPAPTAAPSTPPRQTLPPPSSAAACRATLQAEIDAAEPGSTLDLRGCRYDAGATVDRPLTVVGATVRVPAGEAGIVVEADDVTLDGLSLTGAQFEVFEFGEMGVVAWADPGAPIRDLTIRRTEIASFGGYGTYLRNVAGVRLEANDVHDVVYSGLMVLSGTGGVIEDNVVRRIGVFGGEANEDNAYGIVITTQGTDEPQSADFVIAGNTVEDVPTWHAFDTHGGRNLVFRDNVVRRSMRGMFITTNSAGHEPTTIAIIDNQLLDPAPIETNLAAITLYSAHGVAITGNTAVGWGVGGFLRDFEERSTGVVVSDNTIEP